MQKLITNSIILSFSIIFLGCGDSLRESTASSETTYAETKKSRTFTTNEQDSIKANGLIYLNQLRTNSGMIPYSANSSLDLASYNHSLYLMLNNAIGHGEAVGANGYTGNTPSSRAIATGYPHQQIGENISFGNDSVYDSLDQLFAAIYHRFGFLNFDFDEVGIGADSSDAHAYKNTYTYKMGILNPQDSDENKNKNPYLVVWPYDTQSNSLPVFYEESPDPLPDCSVSGYPISMQFNELKSGVINLSSFKLYFDNNNTEITDTRLLNQNTDPNGKFSDKEFALFPMKRLLWNTKYRVEANYQEDGNNKNKIWSFKTKPLPLPYYTVSNGVTLNVKNATKYLLHLPPSDCNDVISGFSINSTGPIPQLRFYDKNTLEITIIGASGLITIFTNNGKTFNLQISDQDSAIYPNIQSNQTITLEQNWNLIGVNTNLTLDELKTKLGTDSILIIQGGGEVYKKENNSFLNSFTELKPGYGYWIKLKSQILLEYTPMTYTVKTIQLTSGWNLINPMSNLTLEEIKTQIGDTNLEVIQGGEKVYKKSNESFLNSFKKFEEPFGYWIKIANDRELTF